MGIQAPAHVKFELIYEAVSQDNNLLSISYMCRIAGVSRSGYYAWVKAIPVRQAREEKDRADFECILVAFRYRGYKKGARSIHMRLLHVGIKMSEKKVRRLMRKYNLYCPIRRANPYRRLAKAMKTSHVAPNVVNRDFHSRGPRKVLLTDITYLFFTGGCCYLSTILDAVTREILAYELSHSLIVDFVIETVEQLIEVHGCTLDNETIVHSDYAEEKTMPKFFFKYTV